MLNVKMPIEELYMIGESYAKKLHKLDIFSLNDLLHHYPFRYDDWSIISKIKQVQAGERVSIHGQIIKFTNVFTRYGKNIQTGTLGDNSGQIDFIFFNQSYLQRVLKIGQELTLAGIAEANKSKLLIKNPEFEISKNGPNIHTGRLVPIYPETAGLSSKWIRSRIAPLILKKQVLVADFMPADIKSESNLLDLNEAITKIHFPANQSDIRQAKNRLAFDELFILQIQGQLRRLEWQKGKLAQKLKVDKTKINKLIKTLPFMLTKDQARTSQEILADLSKDIPSNRLLQGDVGAGKTIVAAIAIYTSFLNKKKSFLMAPTEILAEQHYQSLTKLFSKVNLKISLITSSHKKLDPSADLIIGTHALLFRDKLDQPALVVIDEQHRFGVAQRSKLLKFKYRPHLLTMTATPIPRSMTLALYGDLDVSIIKQMPPGRKKIKTWVVPLNKRAKAYHWIKSEINKNQTQVFIICPLIEESEHEKLKDIKAVTKEYDYLKKDIFTQQKLALLHGRIKSKKKDEVLADFRNNKYQIMVATPVIEVGIDIPNASIIIIEGAQRFGLAQLHQLRGRVGRDHQQAYCLLFPSNNKSKSNTRLKAMENNHSGFSLAEIDLKIRGPGEIYGTRQSGFRQLKIASLSDDSLLAKARHWTQKILPIIKRFPLLQERLNSLTIADVKPN